MSDSKNKCTYCGGDGWTMEHSCYCNGWHGGSCDCNGEQVECEHCQGTGEV